MLPPKTSAEQTYQFLQFRLTTIPDLILSQRYFLRFGQMSSMVTVEDVQESREIENCSVIDCLAGQAFAGFGTQNTVFCPFGLKFSTTARTYDSPCVAAC